jgi:ABC-type antimicrobial peptide transport system permease subunit
MAGGLSMILGNLWWDLRYAGRVLWKNRGFTAAAVVVLALGIGANTAIFSVVYSVLLKPLPYRAPERLVVALHDGRFPVSPADFLDYRAQTQAFEVLGAAQAWGGVISDGERAESVPGLQVTPDVIATLGVEPLLGRLFSPDEERPASDTRVLLLGYKLWQRRFGGDARIVGQTVRVDGRAYTVVGVMPPQFQFAPFWQTQAEMWTPLVLADRNRLNDRIGRSLRVFGRLKADVPLEQAQAQMDTVAARLAHAYPDSNTDLTIGVVPLHEKVVGSVRRTLMLLLVTVGFVLVIACADIANLLLTRAIGRKREIAVRLAIGASRAGLVRQLAIESILVAACGGLAGLLLARGALDVLGTILPQAQASLPRQGEVGIDAAVFGFALLLSLIAGLMSGLVPALQASRVDLTETLKEGGRSATEGRSRRRTQNALIVVQVSVALVLLVCAGLMIKTLQRLGSVDAGFNPEHLLTLDIAAPAPPAALAETGVPSAVNAGSATAAAGAGSATANANAAAAAAAATAAARTAARVALFERVHKEIASIPGVQAVGAINHLPIGGDLWTLRYDIPGRPEPPPGQEFGAAYRVIRTGYLQAMGITLQRGRDFTERDTQQSPAVVIINERLARRQWPNVDPIGQHLALGRGADNPPQDLTVVGVVRNVRQSDWTSEPGDELYLPYLQRPAAFGLRALTFVVRTSADPDTMGRTILQRVAAVDRDIPLARVQPMEQVIAGQLWRSRLSAMLLSVFAGIALVLAAVGIYGVISYAVRQRTQEIGVRMALGATRRDVLTLVLRQSLMPVGIGIMLGTTAALLATRLVATLLYQVTATDPVTFVAVVACLAVTGVIATGVPAWRAMNADPLAALRSE